MGAEAALRRRRRRAWAAAVVVLTALALVASQPKPTTPHVAATAPQVAASTPHVAAATPRVAAAPHVAATAPRVAATAPHVAAATPVPAPPAPAPRLPGPVAEKLRAGDVDVEVVWRSAAGGAARLALLLHACTHSAYDFFAPGPACPACVGLCEEARVADAFSDAGFDVAAVSSRDRRSGCWADGDAAAARAVVAAWRGRAGAPAGAAVVAFGASSGGWFAEVLGAAGVAAAAFSQVAPGHKAGGHHLLALTSMPRDARGHGRARAFFDAFAPDRRAPFAECAPRAVDAAYLGDRLGVAPAALEGAVAALGAAGHLDERGFLAKDPTRSDWRKVLAAADATGRSDEGRYCVAAKCLPLKAGRSSLAKALHVAWAFHEYCADALPAQIAWALARLSR